MTNNTVQPLSAFECLPLLRRDLQRAQASRKEARARLPEAAALRAELGPLKARRQTEGRAQQARTDEQIALVAKLLREVQARGRKLNERSLRMLEHIRSECRRAGALEDLRCLVIAEARRLPEIVRGLPYGKCWDEYYLVKAAASAAWDVRQTEFQAAVHLFWQSPEGKSFDKVRLKIRDRKRLKDGHWRKPAIKEAKRRREAERFAKMTEEEREALRASRRAKYAAKKARKARYVAMLDDEPMQGVA